MNLLDFNVLASRFGAAAAPQAQPPTGLFDTSDTPDDQTVALD